MCIVNLKIKMRHVYRDSAEKLLVDIEELQKAKKYDEIRKV